MRIVQKTKYYGSLDSYFVEAEPERRLVLFTHYPERRYVGEALALPLPRLVYHVVADPGRHKGHQVVAAYGLAEPVDDPVLTDLYFIPWPNLWAPSHHGHTAFSFSNCGGMSVDYPYQGDDVDFVANIIVRWWGSPFREIHKFAPPYGAAFAWLGLQTLAPEDARLPYAIQNTDLMPHYRRWEDLTVAQAATFPWGRIRLPWSLAQAPGWQTTKQVPCFG